MYKFYNPVKTFQGIGILEKLEEIINEAMGNGCVDKSVLIVVWDESVLENKYIKSYINSQKKAQTSVFKYSNPTPENLFELYSQAKNTDIDLILAVGGGSVLDSAKILATLIGTELENVDELREMMGKKLCPKPKCPWIGVPTTAGTGSEVTCWATIWDTKEGKKLSVERQDNYALAAIVDSALLATMPLKLAVSSAMDAVAHAVESYWAKGRNPITKALAIASIRTIIASIEKLIDNYDEIAYKNEMAKGSMLAGFAFSNTRTTACHSISYPLTMHYNIPHGVAVSMLIGAMITFNDEFIEDREILASAFMTKSLSEVQPLIENILRKASIPCKLSEFGIAEEKIQFLAENGSTEGRIDNNPAKICTDDIVNILKTIY